MSRYNQFVRSEDAHLRSVVAMVVVNQAQYVLQENTGGMSASKIAKRQALALQAIRSVEILVAPFARLCATNGTIAGYATVDLIPDTDVEYVVAVLWDAAAGVVAGE